MPYAYETINKVKRCFRAILATAKKQMLIRYNYAYADYITFKKKPPTEIDCMNEEECKHFYATLLDGARIYPDALDRWLKLVLKEAELPNYTLHSLRHSNVTIQLMAGVPITIVANRVGHSRVSTTLDMYSHFIQSYDVTAADKLDKIFK